MLPFARLRLRVSACHRGRRVCLSHDGTIVPKKGAGRAPFWVFLQKRGESTSQRFDEPRDDVGRHVRQDRAGGRGGIVEADGDTGRAGATRLAWGRDLDLVDRVCDDDLLALSALIQRMRFPAPGTSLYFDQSGQTQHDPVFRILRVAPLRHG